MNGNESELCYVLGLLLWLSKVTLSMFANLEQPFP